MTELGFGVVLNIDFHLAPEALVVTDLFAFRTDRDKAPQGADFIKGFLQGIFRPLTSGDVDKTDVCPFDHIVDGTVGVNALFIPPPCGRLYIFLLGHQAMLLWSGARCCTRTKAMLGSVSAGMPEKKASKAASPPTEVPMPTMGN